jgi:hypothetical protein
VGQGLSPNKAEVIGAIVGASAILGVVVYLYHSKQKIIEGCVESGDDGLLLTTDKEKRAYAPDTGTLNVRRDST